VRSYPQEADHALTDRTQKQLKAIASDSRMQLLQWLKDPVTNFPPQKDGDLILDGVCSVFIARKWDVTAATASRHLSVLTDANLLISVRKKGWTFYRRNEDELNALKQRMTEGL
jgi:DNA-binding transcriptional ArsR family regulator